MTHIAFDRLSELAEMSAVRAATPEEARHLATCAGCQHTMERVGALLQATRALPRDVTPPPEVWDAVRSRVGSRVTRGPRFRVASWLAAAAAVAFIAGAAILIPSRRGPVRPAKAMSPVVPALALGVERQYSTTIAELDATLDAQRPQLAPGTERVVDRSLAEIDTAIAETRQALVSDPGNPELVDILSAHLERKVDLLQRAAELATSF